MKNFTILRMHKDLVQAIKSDGTLLHGIPEEGRLVVTSRDALIRSFKQPYRHREDILNFLRREGPKYLPKGMDDYEIDYVKGAKGLVIGIFILKDQLNEFKRAAGDNRNLHMIQAKQEGFSLLHDDGVIESYGSIFYSPGETSLSTMGEAFSDGGELQPIFQFPSLMKRGTSRLIKLILCSLAFSIPWGIAFITFENFQGQKLLYEESIEIEEQSEARAKALKGIQEEVHQLSEGLSPRIISFLLLLESSGLPPMGVEQLSWSEGEFSLSFWCHDQAPFTSFFNSNEHMEGVSISAWQSEDIYHLSVGAKFHE